LITTNIIIIVIFYLIGSLPFALILTKLSGFGDIRKIGSGNVGATNVLRTGNKFLAFIVLGLDIIKGFIPFLILEFYFDGIDLLIKLFICHFAVLGHIFPIWLKFKGGKGVATYIGFLIGANSLIGFLFLITWMIVALITKYSSLSSVIATLIVPLCFFFINSNYYIVIFFIYLTLIIILKHQKNIKRLLNKTENKIKLSK